MRWIAASVVVLAGPALGQTPPDYDFQFSTVTALGNAPYAGGGLYPFNIGRGRVDHAYRISRLEVTTSQWMEFVNTFSTTSLAGGPNPPPFLQGPTDWWGAERDPTYTGVGRRFRLRLGVERAGLIPMSGISWRDAALFCNWLHHEKSRDWLTIQGGAYDASTFTFNPDGTFNDQLTHSPGAKYWIPTLDEWFKAAHYDPHKFGPGQEGWWEYPTSSDVEPIAGLPGVGQTTAGLALPGFAEAYVPLGAYVDVQSPWGLWDLSGGAREWLEDASLDRRRRAYDGAKFREMFPIRELDTAGLSGEDPPGLSIPGLRIASAVPGPNPIVVMLISALFATRRSRL